MFGFHGIFLKCIIRKKKYIKVVTRIKSLPYAGVIQVKFNGFFISAEFSAPRVIDSEIYLNKIKLPLSKKTDVKK